MRELETLLRAMAADTFPDVSANLIGPAVRKAIEAAQEAAGVNDPKDAMGGLGRVRVRVLADYNPEKKLGSRYTYCHHVEQPCLKTIYY